MSGVATYSWKQQEQIEALNARIAELEGYMPNILECIQTAIEIIDATPYDVENRISLACASGKLAFVHEFLSGKMP